MDLSAGTRLGPYEIVAPLGGELTGKVYRARDLERGRNVAIKIFSHGLPTDTEQRQKFERDMRAAMRLQHPHIRVTYDLERRNDIDFLVMEYLEGETLATRLAKRPLSIHDTLRIAIQMAEALGAAHEQGTIHGGLKPANVLLTGDGVKLLDFGQGMARASVLALPGSPASGPAAENDEASASALGYMAPEQIEGKEPDARSDIFAFGAVLYEMAAGRRPFAGTSPPSAIAAVLASEPPLIGTLRPEIPPELDRLVRTCMAKIPSERPQSAHNLEGELKWIRDRVSEAGTPMTDHGQRRSLERLAWWTTIGALLLAIGMIVAYTVRPVMHSSAPRLQAMIKLPGNFVLSSRSSAIAFSPGGRRLVVVGSEGDEQPRLWLRAAEGAVWQPLAGTEDASYPFWSPDGSSIAFFSGQMLKRIDLSSGAVLTICAAADGRGGSWNRQGTIVFAPVPSGGLYRVAAVGGTPIQVSVPGSASVSHRLPQFLPDGQHVLFYSKDSGSAGPNGVYLLDLETGEAQFLLRADSEAQYVPPGYLAFLENGNLMVQRFSASSFQLRGQPRKVVEDVRVIESGAGQFSFSTTGSLLYQNDGRHVRTQLTWFSLEGKELAPVGAPQVFTSMAVSPDGRWAALRIEDTQENSPIWLYGLAKDRRRLLTPPSGKFADPVWSPDSKQVAYDESGERLYVQAVTGKEQATELWSGRKAFPTAWSSDGRVLAADVEGTDAMDIWLLPVKGGGKPAPFLTSPFNESEGTFSADGHWFSYISDKSGQKQLYVMPFPGPGPSVKVSTIGVVTGGWVPGRPQLAYETPDGRVFAVDARGHGKTLKLGTPHELLAGRRLETSVKIPGLRFFSPDGKRVLLPVAVRGERDSEALLTLVTNWQAGAEKKR